ncbi:hypothetical protein [Dokdonella sp.]|uniref:hypothetical protein n=1 Tax=Dokdonella sp. TaxID=2291710 RepID=UPI003BAE993E
MVAVQNDGKILTVGLYNFENETGIHASRYNNDGSLDTNFAERGRFLILNAEGYTFGVTKALMQAAM